MVLTPILTPQTSRKHVYLTPKLGHLAYLSLQPRSPSGQPRMLGNYEK